MFANKQIREFALHLDRDFIWIGDYSVLYTKGIKSFINTLGYEAKQSKVLITNEEYSLVAHEKNYG